ncbi:MAG TPA: peptidoglycan DD-metalloendopeptidase family protein [Verrucomicrobiae bacterium]|nr:peptidoglycan DD-metalloendopeptidase family protein [Verrucomicrobiae bacterium]
MKQPRTLFPVFVAIAIASLLFGMARMEESAAPAGRAELTKHGAREESSTARLIIPVQGLTRGDLHDTWGDARSEGRRHEGIDIMAPQGAPVVAVADGRIVKFFDSVRGGVTIYQFDQTERLVYYYAHLERRAPNLTEGDAVRQGEVIGYVGMSGNAPVPHLHFEIQRLTAERRWWVADALNPYPYLMTGLPPA